MPSGSATRARRGCPLRTSPGPADPLTAQAQPRPTGLTPAFAAVRARLGLVVLLVALAAVGWWWTAREMQGMDAGPWTALGALGWFLGVWVVMMAAMMFPSVAPTVALYSRMTRRRSPLSPALFVAGHPVTGAGAGGVAFPLAALVGRSSGDPLGRGRAGRGGAGGPPVGAAGATR